jgi:hypothetical protein
MNGFLRTSNVIMDNLNSYLLKDVHLYAFENYLALTGVAQNNKAVNESEPHIVILYQSQANGKLEKLGERYFPVDRGLIQHLCYDSGMKKIYLFFENLEQGKQSIKQSVTFGEIRDILIGNENTTILHSPVSKSEFLTSAVIGNKLCICSEGKLTVHALSTLEYKAALAASSLFNRIMKDEYTHKLFAVVGNSDAVQLSIIN